MQCIQPRNECLEGVQLTETRGTEVWSVDVETGAKTLAWSDDEASLTRFGLSEDGLDLVALNTPSRRRSVHTWMATDNGDEWYWGEKAVLEDTFFCWTEFREVATGRALRPRSTCTRNSWSDGGISPSQTTTTAGPVQHSLQRRDVPYENQVPAQRRSIVERHGDK